MSDLLHSMYNLLLVIQLIQRGTSWFANKKWVADYPQPWQQNYWQRREEKRMLVFLYAHLRLIWFLSSMDLIFTICGPYPTGGGLSLVMLKEVKHWRCPFAFCLFYIKFVSSPLDWPYVMLSWQHYRKRFGNVLQYNKYGVMTDSDSKSRCWSEMALWETCFSNNREHRQTSPSE